MRGFIAEVLKEAMDYRKAWKESGVPQNTLKLH
jgi:hypothetical protein